jgi:hypothetical protein
LTRWHCHHEQLLAFVILKCAVISGSFTEMIDDLFLFLPPAQKLSCTLCVYNRLLIPHK